MSDRTRATQRLFCAFAACVAMTTVARAQAPTPAAVRLAARARALTDTAEQLKRARDALLAAARDLVRDTVRVGPFTLVADARYVELARGGAESAWARLRPYYGESRVRAATASVVFFVRADSLHRLLYWERIVRLNMWVESKLDGNEKWVAPTSVREVDAYLGERVQAFVDATADRPMRLWVSTPPANADVEMDVFANSFLQLQTAGSVPARDCSAGVLAQCASALGLVVPPEPIDRLFTAAERRAIGRRLFEQRRDSYRRGEQPPNPCDDDAPDVECERYVRSLPPRAIPPPMATATRGALVLTALTIGGEGAFDRLFADSTASVLNRLASAADVDRDTLLARWRARVLAARPEPVAPASRVAVAAIIWGIGLAGLALRLARVG